MRAPPKDAVPLGIVTVDYFAWLLRENPEAAKRRFSILIEQDAAERMLSDAGARRPWQHPALAFGLIMRDGGIEASWRRRAQAAMDELRLVLPNFLPIDLADTEFFEGVFNAFAQFSAERGERIGPKDPFARRDRALRDQLLLDIYYRLRRLRTLPDLVPRRRKQAWHRAAAELLQYYQAIVGPCGVSANGPAVRFIGAALVRFGYRMGTRTPAAIERELLRFRKRFPLGNPNALPVIPPFKDPPGSETPTNGS